MTFTPERIAALRDLRWPTGHEVLQELLDEIENLSAENEKHRADVAAAAGEFKVPVPEVGDPVGVLLSANILLRRENEKLRADIAISERHADALFVALTAANNLVARLRAKCEERKSVLAMLEWPDWHLEGHECLLCGMPQDSSEHAPDCAWQRAMEDV